MEISGCSYSSQKKLLRCEAMFNYRYGEHLKPRRKKLGLFTGDWIHQLLEELYTTGEWKKRFKQLKAETWNRMFEEEREDFGGKAYLLNVIDLIKHYMEHWSSWDKDWDILHVEKSFELSTRYGFPIRWKADLIVRERSTGTVCLIETKAKKVIPESNERILEPQPHAYAFLVNRAIGLKVDKIIWNYIRTTPVSRPRILKSGGLSQARRGLDNTDQRSYLKAMAQAGIVMTSEEDIIGMENFLKTLPETLSLERITNSVNMKLGENWVKDWLERHVRYQNANRPIRNWNRNCKWDCDYYNLCQADIRGDVDRKEIIKRDYLVNIKTEKEELK